MNLKLPFGILDEELIHISKVDKGLSCNCTCPSCGHPLVAKKGEKTMHHFAHYRGGECATALETALHLAAKKILSKEKKIVIPAVILKFDSYAEHVVLAGEQTIEFDQVIEERKTEDIVPDIIAIKGESKLLIEIKVTHEVDERKLKKIKRLGLSTIEIDLSKGDRELTEDLLRELIVGNVENKEWLYNAHANRIKERFFSTATRRSIVKRGMARHVDYCPQGVRIWRGKSYANVFDDCLHCPYAYRIGDDWSYVFCGGQFMIDTYDKLKEHFRQLILDIQD
ncbi:competence protein CoiA family protein [Coraliomargarita algicola]|uniref:Competence protein CoiA family protein n=1 Tax=Coraliomargarita algicola TaxID=3092156 RepID=A0ABZ0RRC1_9BACT|nr:competence protein CoiA family protein [Coraliomargarita sp. J2-16]WPJ97643.1 competence protein CoiA family protein [Coraliomargarita sp. J2-16]